jgi:type II secretory pathway predicted ATPase ExeA
MSPGALESLRLLSNINADKDQLLQMILVGQPQLKELLSRPGLEQFRQRVAVDFHLAPLDEEDVALYIAHRLEVAGGNPKLFTLDACMKIAAMSRGVPRTINILCDTTLTYGFAAEADTIGQELVDEVLRDRSQYGVFSAVS